MATKRLIDANALTRRLKLHHDFFVDAWEGFSNLPEKDKARVDEITHCIVEVADAPTVDAVEVVRCGKCEWYDPEGEFCKHWNGVRHPEHYCGDGERKDND